MALFEYSKLCLVSCDYRIPSETGRFLHLSLATKEKLEIFLLQLASISITVNYIELLLYNYADTLLQILDLRFIAYNCIVCGHTLFEKYMRHQSYLTCEIRINTKCIIRLVKSEIALGFRV